MAHTETMERQVTGPGAAQPEETIRKLCLGYPGAHEDHPWGDTVFKVRGKVFVFMGTGPGGFGISAKLPQSGAVALILPFATPTGYGLGKSGWVSARFEPDDPIPYDLLAEWIDESYRAVAPKKLVRELPARATKGEPSGEGEPETAERAAPEGAKPKVAKPKAAAGQVGAVEEGAAVGAGRNAGAAVRKKRGRKPAKAG